MDADQRARQLANLVEEHYALLYRVAFRMTGSAADAEDLTQQTYLTAQTKLDQLREPDHAKAWLCAILRNTYLKNVRQQNGTAVVSLDRVPEPRQNEPAELEFDGDELQTILSELPEEFRTTLVLFYFNQFSYKDIARQMDVPMGTVMSRLSRAKMFLRERLQSRQPAAAKS